MALGPRMTMGLRPVQKMKLTQQQRLVMRAIQAARAQVLEASDEAIEARLAYLIQQNPALKWRGPARPRGGVMDKGFVRPSGDDDRTPMESRWSAPDDLMEVLFNDFRLERSTDAQRQAGFMIIGNLDHRGVLASTVEEIAEHIEVDVEDVRKAQNIVMNLEPEGCGADDLLHYFQFMVQRLYPEDPWFPEIVAMHLDELRTKKYGRIAKSMDLDEEDVEEYAKMLADIPPWPARGYGVDPKEHVIPTMDVVRDPETGAFNVKLHEPPKSRIMIDPRFEAEIGELGDADARREMREQLEEARAIVKQMDERQSLVARIAEIAVREQRSYFERGATHLKTLTMNSVADRLGVDPSSVSRAVKGRYYQVDGRVEELRNLFAHRSKPGKVSEAKLHALIRDIVAGEDKRRPYTDSEIMLELRRRGVREARRTVAKHREKAGIASSRARRKRPEL